MSSTISNFIKPYPPPPYEYLATTVNTQTNTNAATPDIDERYIPYGTGLVSHGRDGWLHYKMSFLSSDSTGFWMKDTVGITPVKHLIQISFGISRSRQDTNEPDCYFTCKLQPRKSTISRDRIANLCANIARLTRIHRGSLPEYCECTFNDLRDGARCVKGGRWAYRLYNWLAALQVGRLMRKHDEMCRCMCFDTPLTNSGLPL
jgi:hypothetical protein